MIRGYGSGSCVEDSYTITHFCGTVVAVRADTAEEAQIAAEAIADGSVACGCAFDAGMREAERDRALAQIERDSFVVFAAKTDWERAARDHDAARGQFLQAIRTCVPAAALDRAVAAERERCLAWWDARCTPVPDCIREMRDGIESGAPAPREG